MTLGPICQRAYRRTLMILVGGLGLVLTTTASCNDQVMTAVLTSLEGLAQTLVQVAFQSIDLGTGEATEAAETDVTVQAITDAVRWMLS